MTRPATVELRLAPAALLVAALGACSAPPLHPDLYDAERFAEAGNHDAALAAYDSAISRCQTAPKGTRRRTCSDAHLHRAELLDRLGRRAEAADALEQVPTALADDPESAAQALFRAGRIRLELGQDTRAYELLWRSITDYPDQPGGDLSLRLLLFDGRRRNPTQLYRELIRLATALADRDIADDLHFALADLAEHELGEPARAVQHYDAVAAGGKRRTRFDDALWHGARMARVAGDFAGAVERYRKLLATREVALISGSYFSQWHPPAQVEMGRVLRDHLADPKAALAAFEALPKLFPDSTMLDDATYERAATLAQLGETERACQTLATLKARWPDSKYELEQGPALRTRLGCRL